MPPLGLGYVAAATPSDWKVTILDEHVERLTGDEKPDLLGIGSFTRNAPRAYEISEHFRKKGVTTVLGGIHPSMMPDEAARYADSVVIGEADWIWKTVIDDFEGGKLKPAYAGDRNSLADLAVPRRDLFADAYLMDTMQTARGCPFKCEFCSVSAFNGAQFRRRPVEQALDEYESLGSKLVYFIDDNFYGRGDAAREWVVDFFNGIIKRRVRKIWGAQVGIDFAENKDVLKLARKAGCREVFIGFESLKGDNLRKMNKTANYKIGPENYKKYIARIHDAGIAVAGAFMIGNNGEDKTSIKELHDFLIDACVDSPTIMISTPLPGTVFWEKMTKENRLFYGNYPSDWEKFDTQQVVYAPDNISVDDLVRGQVFLSESFFSKFNIFRQAIKTLMITRSINATMISAGLNIGSWSFKIDEKRFDKPVRS